MSRQRSDNRALALKLWMKSSRQKKLTEIAHELGVSPSLIRKWKFLDKWDEIPAKRPRGGQPGNQNAVGNSGGPGGPVGNSKALSHGMYSKFLPQDPEYKELFESAMEADPLDMLWQGVTVAYAKMMWAQRIMFVKDKDDQTKVLTKHEEGKFGDKLEWEYQHAWDKQAVDINAFTKISRELRSAIKQFLSAAPENDERRLKLSIMEQQVNKIKAEVKNLDAAGSVDGLTIKVKLPSPPEEGE